MSYRKRKRPAKDPTTGVTCAALKRGLECLTTEYFDEVGRKLRDPTMAERYLITDGEENTGGFDLAYWAKMNDRTCDPRSGGLAHPSSMAAVGGVSRHTLVNSVFPMMEHSLHRVGPVTVSTVNTVVPACREFRAKARSRQSAAGRRNAVNLIRWEEASDVSPGYVFSKTQGPDICEEPQVGFSSGADGLQKAGQ